MQIQPTSNQNFSKNTVIKYVKPTAYGRCIHGHSKRGFDYDVYIDDKGSGKNVMYKLYYITKDNKWVKSVLRFFSGNKAYKEVKSENWL